MPAPAATRSTSRPARRAPRSGFGAVRKLPSGRHQARYTGPDGLTYSAPATFSTRRAADDWLTTVKAAIVLDRWEPPAAAGATDAATTLGEYADRWLAGRLDLAPRTRALYARLLVRWVDADVPRPTSAAGRTGAPIRVGALPVGKITPAVVREWTGAVQHAARASATERDANARNSSRRAHPARSWAKATGRAVPRTGRLSPDLVARWEAAGRPEVGGPGRPARQDAGSTQAAHAYRLLRTVLTTAVREGLLPANPCQVPRAAAVRTAERVPATAAQVDAIAAAMPARYRAAVTVAAWSALRAGELFALTRRDVDLTAGTVRVERAMIELDGQPVSYGPPKSAAGRRTVHLPAFVLAQLRDHLAEFVPEHPDALVFATSTGRPLRGGPRGQIFRRARAAAGRPDLRWHDLRHTGATEAARTGATLRSLQRRMGHSTVRAALIYQHATDADDALIAARLDAAHASPGRVVLVDATNNPPALSA